MSEEEFVSVSIKRIGDLTAQLAAVQDELKTGNHLYAQLTDKKNDLENELTAAKAEIEKLERLLDMASGPYESETKRLRTEIEYQKQINALNAGSIEEGRAENERLRETIQRNEDKSVECERLSKENENLKIIDTYRTSPTPWLVSECERLREALENIRLHEEAGKADEDIPDDKEDAYRLGYADALMDIKHIARAALDGGKA